MKTQEQQVCGVCNNTLSTTILRFIGNGTLVVDAAGDFVSPHICCSWECAITKVKDLQNDS